MSGGVEILSGGAVAVDTDSLRHVAGVCAQLAAECADAGGWMRRAADAARATGLPLPFPVAPLTDAERAADHLARALRERADVYDAIEHAAANQLERVARADDSEQSAAGRAGIDEAAAEALRAWRDGVHREVNRQYSGALSPTQPEMLLLGPLVATMLSAMPAVLTWSVREADLGLVPRDAPPLTGAAPPVTLSALSTARTAPPSTLAEIAQRMPGAGDSRVRVESFTGPDGGRAFIVYISGTQSLGGDDPWDMASNLDLYGRRVSASYAAVDSALAAAGAVRGDVVNIAGHSQGAMLGSHLARSGAYDVGWLVTFGSPVQVVLPDDVVQVTVRHTDDPVVALAAGGAPTVAGASGSFIVERLADPVPRFDDFRVGVHQMTAYQETATLADDSDDPRIRAFHTGLQGIAGGAIGTAVVYGARRVRPVPDTRAPAPAPARREVSGASSAGGGG